MVYQWKTGRSPGIDAQVAGRELERIKDEHEGDLRPEDVVETARPKDSPLHPCFEWDGKKAAEKWRKHQARHIINSLYVIERREDGPVSTIAYINVRPQDAPRCYRTSSRVMSTDDLRAQSLADAMTSLQAWRRRYDDLQELSEVHEAIDRVGLAVAQ